MSDNAICVLMLVAVTAFALFYLVRIPGAIRQFDKVQRNRPKRIIDGKEYFWLANILRRTTRLGDPRPQVVIDDFKCQGYEVVVLEDAKDIWGKEDVPECRSVWGRMPDKAVGTSQTDIY